MKTFFCWLLSKINPITGVGILAAMWCALTAADDFEFAHKILKPLLVIGSISFILSVWAAVFTFKNFDEVYSRSKRWRNSNVDRLDVRISYSFGMFVKCLFAFPVIIMLFGGIFYILKYI